MMTTRARLAPLVAATVLLAGRAGVALAQSCAMCASSFGPNDPVTKAFNWSIIFLMAAPYTLFGTVAGYVFFTYWRAAGRRRADVVELPAVRGRRTPEEVS
jgi:hypothetical protein